MDKFIFGLNHLCIKNYWLQNCYTGSLNGKRTRFPYYLTKNCLKNSDYVEMGLFIIYNYHI